MVYVSDGQNGAIYRCPPGCASLETWLPAGTFRSAQGMAVSADGRLLYVADYRYGLAAVDRASGHVFRMSAPPDMMLDGIDGLVRDHDGLIAIQNGAPPLRIVALSLSSDGLGITGASRRRARRSGLGRALARRGDRRPAGLCLEPAMGPLRRPWRGDRRGAGPADADKGGPAPRDAALSLAPLPRQS